MDDGCGVVIMSDVDDKVVGIVDNGVEKDRVGRKGY